MNFFTFLLFNLLIYTNFTQNKIASIGTCTSEIICKLNECDNIVASDSSSLKELNSKVKNLGYWRAINLESILASQANLVILSNKVQPQSIIKKLKNLKINTILLKSPKSWNELFENITLVANELNKQKEANQIVYELQNILKTKSPKKYQNKKFAALYSMGSNSWYLLGKDSASNHLLKQLNIKNISPYNSSKITSLEAILNLNPDGFLLNQSSSNFLKQKTPFVSYLNQKDKLIVKDTTFTESCISSIHEYKRLIKNEN